ncbi:hypothetical protein [Oceanobacillus neutriphilus]|uniref:Uncharacterized protein n=1 Tax=Oceanobacillus neutriphilus TaxID=531815 RepID=A0ABQ2P3F8_9BACI|nr:hypothetical protein [Oceanobacillus neutriphilus]GGP17182.1 hypothetical protein GCM10011346_52090 [Oceanobacillus neutriphilus]
MNEIKEKLRTQSACFIDYCMLGMQAIENGEFEKSDLYYQDAQNSLNALRNIGEESKSRAVQGLIDNINKSHGEVLWFQL